ncbi:MULTISPECIES: glycoside hydrolase family 26 protein [Micromonospora]|uniref:Beta-mannanase n=1 Tax=Micromonospora sicca TaxID=2202420 RepID=A0A317DL65_9ACTN|nr:MULTISPECIES: glycosyl hydrolase [unclassified Micromonospora]MBM0226167.1 beta-mannanase [Micromonospora sp. ATA51]PWR15509.1 beta-mannanase [Micromonospora sp. 4G51]
MVRVTVPRVLLMLSGGVLVLTYGFTLAPVTSSGGRGDARSDRAATAEAQEPAQPGASPRPARELFPPAGKTFIGVMTEKGPHDFTATNMFTAAAKRQPQAMLFTSGWASDTFDRTLFDQIKGRGMLPMLAWEPWDYRPGEAAHRKGLPTREVDRLRNEQPRYRLSHITRGDFDSYLRSWADGIKSLGYPVAIRFGHEMNGYWYPWCETVNGNRPGDYVKAWRHIHDLFRAAGATNVTWVWSPNNRWDDSTPKLSTLYPGDDYVDWVGISGYYSTVFTSEYRSFDLIFNQTIEDIRVFTSKPLVITETGASDVNGRKAEWIEQTFQLLSRHKDIIGFIWFEVDKEVDWRIASSPAAARAFAKAVADPRYQFTWSPDMLLRTELED